MMKKITLLLTIALMAMQAVAANVDRVTAQAKAEAFLKSQATVSGIMTPAAVNPVLLNAEMGDVKLNQPVYYIFSTSTTFIVVAGDDRAEEILMVGDAPLSDVGNLSPGMKAMLRQYKNEIMFLQEHPGLKVDPVSPRTTPSRAVTYGPLLTCNWGQGSPFNNRCSFQYGNNSYQCMAGPAATAASMVMYFWKRPATPTPEVPAYRMLLNGMTYLNVDALPSITFDWANMRDDYSVGYTTAQGNAVATLMRYVGQAMKTNYGTSTYGSYIENLQDIVDMFTLFGYDESSCRVVQKESSYTDAQWGELIQQEMADGRPVIFIANDSYYGGSHAFNVDGYRDSDSKYHINFGWDGINAWCVLNAFGYSDDDFSVNYNQNQEMIIGIQPLVIESTLTVTPTSLTFKTATGSPVTKTFIVTGANLTDNVYLTCSGTGFSIDKTTITQNAATEGATVTVTYNPTAYGTHTGTVTLTSTGAQDVTVALNGQASLVKYAPVMLPAAAEYINLTKFRADWTDETPAGNVASYTLKVSSKSAEPVVELLSSVAGTDFVSSQTYYDIVLPAPWGGNNLRGVSSRAFYFRQKGYQNAALEGMITYTIPDDYDEMTFTLKIITDNTSDGTGNFTVETPHTAATGYNFSAGETHSWLVTASAGEMITITSTKASFSPDIALIEVYSGNATIAEFRATETGDESNRLITGITDKYYTVENLTAGDTFRYKVKALYLDGTESAWSNVEEVTLSQNSLKGDVNRDGDVSIADVTALIDYLLSGDTAPESADCNNDGSVSIADVTSLIDYLLSGHW